MKTVKRFLQKTLKKVHSDQSTILVPSGDLVRVDVAQNVTLFDMVVGLTETLRDIVYQYIAYGQNNKEIDPMIVGLVSDDERMYRIVLSMLVMRSFQESFAEFQKVMGESQGKATPQSNFIVQNELVKYAGFLRFSRQHVRATDNETLDLLDETLKVIEMTEGRRQRPDNKGFKEIFDDLNNKLNATAAKFENTWKQTYQRVVTEVTKNQQPVEQAN